jgi:DNA-directed RNA polymerase specialized sigma24 family protein
MPKTVRITLTKAQAEGEDGHALLNLMLDICHDGEVTLEEAEDLYGKLRTLSADIPAVPYLRCIAREAIADGTIDKHEAYNLKKAMMRVATKEVRGVIETHLDSIGLPPPDRSSRSSWRGDPATARQLDYIVGLGGQPTDGMAKGEASDLIEELLERRPPTPRQVLLLRFFDRVDLMGETKDAVSAWIDEVFARSLRHEQAWMRFKRETNHDPHETDPATVPVGAYRDYLR